MFVGALTDGLPNGRGDQTGKNFLNFFFLLGEFVYGEGKKKSDKYIGEFRNGMFHGQGEYYSRDGSKFTGEFSEGLRSGGGVLQYPSGESREGTWATDNLVGK